MAMDAQREPRFAILIDADNVSDKYIKIILDEVANSGVATYKRIYGDWTSQRLAGWKDCLLENSIIPMQQYSYTTGKNATDSAMIIDAMDILYSGNVEGFVIVSSDSDFTRLVARLRESGMQVIGMGEQKTPEPFISACNQFKYLDLLFASRADESEDAAAEDAPDDNAVSEGVKEQLLPVIMQFTEAVAADNAITDDAREDFFTMLEGLYYSLELSRAKMVKAMFLGLTGVMRDYKNGAHFIRAIASVLKQYAII